MQPAAGEHVEFAMVHGRRSLIFLAYFMAVPTVGCKGGDVDGTSITDGLGTGGSEGDGTGGTSDGSGTRGGDEDEGGGDGPGDGDDGGDGGDPVVPHARGTIVLGESHPPQSSNSSPIVTASFVPDFDAQPEACGTDVAGCFVQTPPDCEGLCELDEFCTFDDACKSTCQRVCDLGCAADEVCYFPIPNNPACKKIEYFDAGALNFTGTTVPITLFPPYQFQGDVTGALFLPESEVTVHASGASQVGVEAFEKSFTTTRYLDTQIEDLGLEEIYGTRPLPVTWTAGADEITIQLTVSGLLGGYGTVTCEADDGGGSFGVPRAAIEAVLEDEDLNGVHVTTIRRRSEIHKGLTTTGQLLDQTVQPEAWLELVSTSVESVMLTGCNGLGYCGGECVEVSWNDDHCGGCDNPCSVIEACEAGTCVSTCGFSEVPCGNVCVNTSENDAHCGGCNQPCDSGQQCIGGTCTGSGDGGDGGDDGGNNTGNCCVPHAGTGCTIGAIQTCVCNSDPFCCSDNWDAQCAGEVESLGCGMCP
jgi:hypothetical protein